ncbi:MAG: phosphate uptake regulator PhoU [Alphaproteobacteria bacterium]|nr:phosphate uptake regulator PhoU [Alphaproteobacteria bacterium]
MIQLDSHAFKGFDESLHKLVDLLSNMSKQVESLITLLPAGLEAADSRAHAEAKNIDKLINDAEINTDKAVAEIVGKFNLVGEELRFVLGSVKAAGALERLADRMKNCSKRLAKIPHPMDDEIKHILSKSISSLKAMIPLSLQQLFDYKPEVSKELLNLGAEVQRAYRHTLLRLNALKLTAEDTHHILLVAKNLDQASDMAIEIMKIGHYVNLGTKYEKAS